MERTEARRLGWTEIEARISEGNDREVRMWEISENLHRAELNAMERAEHVSEWIRLKTEEEKPAQLAPVSAKGGRGNQGGTNAAVRELGVERTEAQRSVKIASLPPEVKKAARELGLTTSPLIRSPVARATKKTRPGRPGRLRS